MSLLNPQSSTATKSVTLDAATVHGIMVTEQVCIIPVNTQLDGAQISDFTVRGDAIRRVGPVPVQTTWGYMSRDMLHD